MTTMSMEAILERIRELKQENQEKDEVIRDQQVQINELERREGELAQRCEQLQEQIVKLESAADSQLDQLVEQLSAALN